MHLVKEFEDFSPRSGLSNIDFSSFPLYGLCQAYCRRLIVDLRLAFEDRAATEQSHPYRAYWLHSHGYNRRYECSARTKGRAHCSCHQQGRLR
jgi:hypothetical protein